MALYNLIISLWACHLCDVAPEYFSDPIQYVRDVKVFTVEGWYEITDSAAETASPSMLFFMRGFFMFAVLTGGLLGFPLTTAVFVDETVMDNTEPLEAKVESSHQRVRDLKAMLLELSERRDQSG